MNVIFNVVDALRFDHLRISGYNRDTSPVFVGRNAKAR